MRLSFILASMLLSLSVLASGPVHFNNIFKINRSKSGDIKTISIRVAPQSFSMKPFINSLVEKVKYEKQRVTSEESAAETAQKYHSFTESLQPPTSGDVKYKKRIKQSLAKLRSLDIRRLRSQLLNSKILKDFQAKINDQFLLMHPGVVANLDDARFYFKRKTGLKVVETTLNLIKKSVNDVPLLNTLSFLVSKIPPYLKEFRSFHQNMLIYYLENYSERELGITKEEADKIMSSIFESRVGAFNIITSNKIAESWLTYGYDQFYSQMRVANNALRFSKHRESLGERVNFAFQAVEEKEEKILNLFSKKHMFSSEFAVAFYPNRPFKVFRTRFYIYLAQVGLSFVPKVPGLVKSAVNSFLDSIYAGQGSVEGSLYIHYLESGNEKMANRILLQNMNPYLSLFM